jgi:hypothetical protein
VSEASANQACPSAAEAGCFAQGLSGGDPTNPHMTGFRANRQLLRCESEASAIRRSYFLERARASQKSRVGALVSIARVLVSRAHVHLARARSSRSLACTHSSRLHALVSLARARLARSLARTRSSRSLTRTRSSRSLARTRLARASSSRSHARARFARSLARAHLTASSSPARRYGCFLLDDHAGVAFTGHLDGGSYLTDEERAKSQQKWDSMNERVGALKLET